MDSFWVWNQWTGLFLTSEMFFYLFFSLQMLLESALGLGIMRLLEDNGHKSDGENNFRNLILETFLDGHIYIRLEQVEFLSPARHMTHRVLIIDK